MLDALAITEEEAAGLAELAALDLAMAKDFAARARAAEDPATANDLGRSYQRMARSYRQTLALKMRLAREMASHDRETIAERRARSGRPSASGLKRADELRDAVERVAWAEHEGPEREATCDFVLEMLEEALAEDALDPAFARRPLDALVADTCHELGLDPKLAARWRDLPDPPDDDAQAPLKPPVRDTG